MIVLGLTGGIGMGKTVTAQMLREEGVPVHDADEAVHRLYAGPAAERVEQEFPGVLVNGIVDRERLAGRVLGDADALRRLEQIVHPLVRDDAEAFVKAARERGAKLVVLDIPLLFETGGRSRVDKVLVVSAPAELQRARVLARPGMTPEKFEAILARQMPDAEKRRLADFVIDTSGGFEEARTELRRVIGELIGPIQANGLPSGGGTPTSGEAEREE
ncbi:MAG TPA: dephospho-CoA kinase [Mesorhizobium sp.]|jgi:dephospho-CoA kinase|nr:dephospho-CoA kinase [Mesorhizobium sp.]